MEVLHPRTKVEKIHDSLFGANSVAERRSYLLPKILLGFPPFPGKVENRNGYTELRDYSTFSQMFYRL